MHVVHYLGKDVPQSFLNIINAYRKKEFNSNSEIKPEPENLAWEQDMFLLLDGSENILAFGRLHSIAVDFLGKEHDIYGIASIFATEKGKGYGKYLMESIKSFIEKSEKSAIGFCNPNVSEFYKKSGYGILPGNLGRFVHVDENGQKIPPRFNESDDVLFLNGQDNLIGLLLDNPESQVIIHQKHW